MNGMTGRAGADPPIGGAMGRAGATGATFGGAAGVATAAAD
jgi:hypothetical protein